MARVSGSITLNLPVERCYNYLQQSVRDERFLRAYFELRAPLKYSGEVTALEHGRLIRISEDGYDTLTNLRLNGWTVSFRLTRLDAASTRVDITVEYGLMLAVLGLTTMKPQAENEILAWTRALLALEAGVGRPAELSLPPEDDEEAPSETTDEVPQEE